ncbi:MAG: ATP-binding protein, partial [Candidatus Pacearchaeota archaeon]
NIFYLKLISFFLFLILIFSLFFIFKNFFILNFKKENGNYFFEQLIENLNNPLIGYDENFKIIYFNKKAEEYFNLKKVDILNLKITPENLKDNKLKNLTQIIYPSLAPIVIPLSEPNIWPIINEIQLESPTKRYLRTYTLRLFNQDQNLFYFFKIIEDFTRERELLILKNDFISAAAHQTRTPLTAISWAFETLINLNKDESLNEIIFNGFEATQRALKIINDLLNVSKIEEGKFGYNFKELELNDYLKNILVLFDELKKEYNVEIYFNPSSEQINVKIDPDKFGLAFSNFIDNAIRYNVENGKVEIFVEKLKEKPFVRILIKDTGIGIPEENLKFITQKFYRASNASTKEPNGSGLGLYISKNIIKQHGGDFFIESVLNRGTKVSIYLPLDFSLIKEKELPNFESL